MVLQKRWVEREAQRFCRQKPVIGGLVLCCRLQRLHRPRLVARRQKRAPLPVLRPRDGNRCSHRLTQRAEMRQRGCGIVQTAQRDETGQEFQIGIGLPALQVMAGRHAIGELGFALSQQGAHQIGTAVAPGIGVAQTLRGA